MVKGSRQRPWLDATFQGSGIIWRKAVKIGRLALKAHVRADDPSNRITLDLRQCRAGPWQFYGVSVTASGRLTDHRLHLDAHGPLGTVQLHAAGGYRADEAVWQGTIDQLPVALIQPWLPELKISGNLRGRFRYRQQGQSR